MPMSFFPRGPTTRPFGFIEASPSALLDAVQLPVILYVWILPLLYLALWIFLILYLFCLPFSEPRRRMRAIASQATVKNMLAAVHGIETKVLRSNWSAFLYIVLLGTPLVAILCVIYGHHPLSLSVYDSPFQLYATLYGFMFLINPLFIFPMPGKAPALVLLIIGLIVTFWFWSMLTVLYVVALRRGIHPVLRRHMLSVGIFTAIQPFVFRFLRFTALPAIHFTGRASPFFGYNSTYVIAFFLPCLLYALGGLILHRRLQKELPSWFFGLHAALFYLAVLASDLH